MNSTDWKFWDNKSLDSNIGGEFTDQLRSATLLT
jgi:hypothetical protein